MFVAFDYLNQRSQNMRHGISLSYTGIASGFGYWYCLKFKGPNRKLRGPGSSTIGSEECGSNDSKKCYHHIIFQRFHLRFNMLLIFVTLWLYINYNTSWHK